MSSTFDLRQPLTPEEKQAYGQLFQMLDPEGLGIVTGESIVPVFPKSGLPPTVLSEIWELADPENLGFLNQLGFSIALRLIGHIQAGGRLSKDLYATAGPMPKFYGLTGATAGSSLNASAPVQPLAGHQMTGQSLTSQSTALPPLTPGDVSKFGQLFDRSAVNGSISGEVARDIFIKAKLPTQTLGQIWNIVDRSAAGSLNRQEFVVAMYLIQSFLSGTIRVLPPVLPQPVWDAASGLMSANSTGSRPQLNRVPSSFGNASNDWSLSFEKKQQFDALFDSLDKSKRGTLSSQELVPFFLTSRLSQDTLAAIWDLADIHNNADFTKTEFALAMFLIQKNNAGYQLPDVIPETLVSSPALGLAQQTQQFAPQQTQQFAPQQTQQFAPQPAATQQFAAPAAPSIPSRETKPSALDDLLDLNETFKATPAPAPAPAAAPAVAPLTTSTTGIKQFVPTSSFGQSIAEPPVQKSITGQGISAPAAPATPATTSFAPPAAQFAPPAQSPSFTGTASSPFVNTTSTFARNNTDLFADSNPEISGKLSQATTDLANLSTQVGSLTGQATQLHDKRTRAENELARVTKLKSDIQAKLEKLRTSYTAEVARTEEVEKLLLESRKETDALQQQVSVAEANYHAVESNLQQNQQELESSQKENAALKEKIGQLNALAIELNTQLENVQKEARHQKGLVAINTKQVNVNEASSAGIRAEIAAIQEALQELFSKKTELDNYEKSIQEQHAQLQEKHAQFVNASQQHEESTKALEAKQLEFKQRSLESQQQEQYHSEQQQHLSQLFEGLRKRQQEFSAAQEQLQQQQLQYAAQVQDLSERQLNLALGEPVDQQEFEKFKKSIDFENKSSENDVFEKSVPETEATEDTAEPEEEAFTLPMPAGSVTSSVANNAAQSVRDETVEPEVLPGDKIPHAEFHDEAVSKAVIPDGAKLAAAGAAAGAAIVGAVAGVVAMAKSDETAETKSDETAEADEPESSETAITAKQLPDDKYAITTKDSEDKEDSVSVDLDSSKAPTESEFPPIQELPIDESESESESEEPPAYVTPTDYIAPAEKTAEVPAAKSAKVPPAAPASRNSFVPAAPVADTFDDAFGDLAPAEEDYDEFEECNDVNEAFEDFSQQTKPVGNDEWVDLFSGFGNAPASAPNAAPVATPTPSKPSVSSPVARGLATTPKSLAIEELTSMGFSHTEAVQALEKCNWDLESATNMLLDSA